MLKRKLLDMFLLNLYGTVNAENKVMVIFNIPNSETKKVEDYLSENKLFADEPTMNIGKFFTEFSIQVAKDDKNLPLAKIRYEPAKLGAVNIDPYLLFLQSRILVLFFPAFLNNFGNMPS